MWRGTILVETTPHLLKRASLRVKGKESHYWNEERARYLITRAIEGRIGSGMIIDSLKRINLSEILTVPGLDKVFDCLFFYGRKAKIMKTRKGYFYY